MSLAELVVYLVVALLCGIAGQLLAGRSLGGWLTSTIVGLFGAVVGGTMARSIGAPEPLPLIVGDRTVPILWSVVGAALVTFVVAWLRRESRGHAVPDR